MARFSVGGFASVIGDSRQSLPGQFAMSYQEGSHSTESSGPGFGVNLAEIFDPGRGNRSKSSAENQEPGESFPFWTWTEAATTSFGTSTKGVQLGKRILPLFVSYDGTEFLLLLQLFVLCCDLY
ncbi:uncharacterized protein LOC117242180 [Bombus vosnesenskii]|uniref:Uncharacterized protein LOC117242180 n=1 Tax=Bombus vosnesenskii TaxID=207650 RepID=A0A6J3LGM9_9HYME|nr:uncharacterized protein LOC117242180 [Bombus vosnesenskii]